MSLAGKTIFISGGSRGIGLAIALRAARDGANIAVAAKTAEPHAKLEGTIYTAAEQIDKAGGRALPLVIDIRDEERVAEAVREAADKFGGIDILINNASAIRTTGTLDTQVRRYDLMHGVNEAKQIELSVFGTARSHSAVDPNFPPPRQTCRPHHLAFG